jgi:DGQHR domain-containing protein
MNQEFPVLPVEQPIGVFYIASIPADILLKTLKNVHRSMGGDGVQRDASKSRIKEIASFCSNKDSVFPTPIIVSVYNNIVKLDEDENKLSFDDNSIIGEVLDGQHRLLGLEDSDNSNLFNMPVVFMFGLTPEEKAYIFSIINSKQTKVNQSLLYDLFELTSKRSPQKTAHEIARSMNSMQESPFFNRLKMLGTKDVGQDLATLSQGTFAQSIMLLFSKHPNKDKERLYSICTFFVPFVEYVIRYFITGTELFNGDALRHCFRLVLEIESFQIFAAVHKSMFKFWQQSYNFQN